MRGLFDQRRRSAWGAVLHCLLPIAVLVLWHAPAAAQVAAGSSITNVAALHYDLNDGRHDVSSNPATLLVAERLDLTLAPSGSQPIAATTGTIAVPFVLTNTGNGTEAFQLAASVDAVAGSVRLVAIDADGDGRFDASVDTAMIDGRTPALPPGGVLPLLVVFDTASPPAGGSVTLMARAQTGSGQAGATFAGQGDGGSDAVVGTTGATASVSVPLLVDAAAPSLNKSQSVVAPDGSDNAVSGAVITYTLAAQFAAATGAATVSDPIPAGTAYLPGSLTLDGAALTDAADGDAGQVGADGISVGLGAVAAAATHTVRFSVTIQ